MIISIVRVIRISYSIVRMENTKRSTKIHYINIIYIAITQDAKMIYILQAHKNRHTIQKGEY